MRSTTILKVLMIFFFIMITLFPMHSTLLHGETTTKKKLYIHNLKSNGVDSVIINKIKEGITLSILSNAGERYHIVDEDSIKIMYKQAEQILSSGCTNESCLAQIADGINADEIIYGTLTNDSGKLHLMIKNMYRKNLNMGLFSAVDVSFYETQIDHFSTEIGKKLIDPKYKINMRVPDFRDDKIQIKAIEIEKIKGIDLSLLKFQVTDDITKQMLDHAKTMVQEGDDKFQKNDFRGAIEIYTNILQRIKTKLLPEQQKSMLEFSNGVKDRIELSYFKIFQLNIENKDEKLQNLNATDEKTLLSFKKMYNEIREEINNVPNEFSSKLSELKSLISQREDVLTALVVTLHETNADNAYKEYQFDAALAEYEICKSNMHSFRTIKILKETEERIDNKIKTTEITGTSFITSKVNSLLDVAVFYNFKDESYKAKATLRQAKDMLDNTRLANDDIKQKYAKHVELIGGEELLSVRKEREKKNYEEKLKWEEEKKQKKLKEEEALKKGFVFIENDQILDVKTNLVWNTYMGTNQSWTSAIGRSETVGGGNWRLPTVDELLELKGNLNKTNFNVLNLKGYFWTSDEYISDKSCAWLVDINTGKLYYSKKIISSIETGNKVYIEFNCIFVRKK